MAVDNIARGMAAKALNQSGRDEDSSCQCLRVLFTLFSNDEISCDKSYEEVDDAIKAGKFVYANRYVEAWNGLDSSIYYYVGKNTADVDAYLMFENFERTVSINFFEDDTILIS